MTEKKHVNNVDEPCKLGFLRTKCSSHHKFVQHGGRVEGGAILSQPCLGPAPVPCISTKKFTVVHPQKIHDQLVLDQDKALACPLLRVLFNLKTLDPKP